VKKEFLIPFSPQEGRQGTGLGLSMLTALLRTWEQSVWIAGPVKEVNLNSIAVPALEEDKKSALAITHA